MPSALAAAAAALWLCAGALSAQTSRTATVEQQVRGDERPLTAHIEYGAGTLTLAPAPAGTLYRMELRYDADEVVPLSEYDAAAGTLRLGVAGQKGDRRGSRGKRHESSRAAILLAREVPTLLELEFGAAEATLDLGGMTLRGVDISTGASKTELRVGAPNRIAAGEVRVSAGAAAFHASGLGNLRAERYHFSGGVGETVLDFGGAWNRNAEVDVSMGVGSLTLRFPRSLGVHLVRKSTFMTRFSAAGLVKREDGYYSANWSRAAHRLTVNVGAALGSVNVEWID